MLFLQCLKKGVLNIPVRNPVSFMNFLLYILFKFINDIYVHDYVSFSLDKSFDRNHDENKK